MAVALVLGGGGVVGISWEIGVLLALEETGTLHPGDAAVVVGTSAGSVVGARLALGVPLHELADEQLTPATPAGDEVIGAAAAAGATDRSKAIAIFQLWGRPERMTRERAAQIGALATEVPSVTQGQWLSSFQQQLGGSWPDRDLRVVTTRVADGERVVLTSASGAELYRAVAASCAVPGLFPPVTIDGAAYVDGGVWSCGSTDVATDTSVTGVIHLAPMFGLPGLGPPSRLAFEHESGVLGAAGVAVETIEPGDSFSSAGISLMDSTKRAEALDIGRAEGRAAADRVARLIRA